MRHGALAVLLAAGCGRLGFDATSRSDAAGAGEAPPADAADCSWGTPRLQAALMSADDDWEPALHPSGLVLVFTRQASTTVADLWWATRASPTADFGAPMQVPSASTSGVTEYGPAWSADGKTLYFMRDAGAGLEPSKLAFSGGAFTGQATAADLPLGASWELASNDLEVFYDFSPDVNQFVLRHETRAAAGMPWSGDDGALAALNLPGRQSGWPTFDALTQTIYFESGDPVDMQEIMVATRPGPGMPFGAPSPLAGFDMHDGDPDFSDDALTLAFASERTGNGESDIYMTTRACE